MGWLGFFFQEGVSVFYAQAEEGKQVFGDWCQNPLPVLPGHTAHLPAEPLL